MSALVRPAAPRACSSARITDERCKIHDIIMQGIDAALRKRGYPPVEDLKAGKKD
jgi:hypothetical protein